MFALLYSIVKTRIETQKETQMMCLPLDIILIEKNISQNNGKYNGVISIGIMKYREG